ncbi:MAG: PAS domain S-box protein [Lentisphaerae bacterium]|nr:PAS domain S-box protein [Lentisphaerota bacterium]
MEIKILHLDESVRTVLWNSATLFAADGQTPIATIAQGHDITARIESENALKESEGRFVQLAEQSRTIAWEVDFLGMYTYVSEVSLAVLGYRPDELVGRMHFYDFHPESGRKEFKEAAFAVFAQKKPFHDLENAAQTKDGQSVWLSTNGFPLLDAAGRLLGSRGSDTDITARKKAEVEKADLESRLRQSQKMETLGQLAGGISHDFNNLLSVISGYSQILLMNPELSDSTKHQIEEINQASERAAGLTRQLLLFSRREPLESKIINIDTVISGIEKMLWRLIKADIIVTRNIGPDLWRIKADPGSIEQVIMNLVINASDAMPDGGTLIVETENVQIDETNHIIAPKDNQLAYLTLSA